MSNEEVPSVLVAGNIVDTQSRASGFCVRLLSCRVPPSLQHQQLPKANAFFRNARPWNEWATQRFVELIGATWRRLLNFHNTMDGAPLQSGGHVLSSTAQADSECPQNGVRNEKRTRDWELWAHFA